MTDLLFGVALGIGLTLAALFPRGRSRMPSLAPESNAWDAYQAELVRSRTSRREGRRIVERALGGREG